MNVKDLLPIGSVIQLKGAEKRLMVFGVRQTDRSDKKEYDYIGVLYPEGNIGEQGQFLFNHEILKRCSSAALKMKSAPPFSTAWTVFTRKTRPSNKVVRTLRFVNCGDTKDPRTGHLPGAGVLLHFGCRQIGITSG